MSSTVSTLGQMLDNTHRLRLIQGQMADLQTQLSSGKKSQNFAGLGSDGIISQRTRVTLTQMEVYQSNITTGVARIKQTDQTIAELREQAENMADFMAGEQQNGSIDFEKIKSYIDSTLPYIRELLNTKDDDNRYALGGADSFTPPMSDTGAHEAYMASLMTDWRAGTITTDQLIANYSTTPETTMGYSASLSSNQVRNVYIRADINVDVDYTTLANSSGIKDILNGMAIIKGLDIDKIALETGDNPATVKTAPGSTSDEQKLNFFKLYEDAIKRINSGINELEKETVKLQKAQLTLETISEGHKLDRANLEGALAGIENSDTSEIAVRISGLQIQMTAAYQVTALMGNLSLANYL
jgi:flagellar hook-associated protein 3 FlgL